ncbi:MAG: co-chaperone GroES family protein [Candidatus Sulfobium sp.]
MKAKRNLIVVGDRVLIDPDERENKTNSGLYLPATVKEKEKVMSGHIVKVGPGYPVHDHTVIMEEPWSPANKLEMRYMPLQAVEGDYALFLRDAAVEIEFEGRKYLIVPHSAILALVRTEIAEFTER